LQWDRYVKFLKSLRTTGLQKNGVNYLVLDFFEPHSSFKQV